METLLQDSISKYRDGYARITSDIRNGSLDETKVSLHVLNDDCLKHLLHYLGPSQLMQNGIFVCKRWFVICTEILFCVAALRLSEKMIIWKPKEKSSFYTLIQNRLYFALHFSQEVISNLTLSGPIDSEDLDKELKPQYPELTHCTLHSISVFCPNLTVLAISRFHLHGVPQGVLLGPLRELTVNQCGLSEADLNNILSGLCSLCKLDVSCNPDITGESITRNLQNNSIRDLSVSGCGNLHPALMPFVFNTFHPSLEKLDVSSNRLELFQMLTNSPQPIPKLSVIKSFKVTDRCYNDFLRDARGSVVSTYDMRVISVLQQMPGLEILHITTLPFWGFRNAAYVSRADYLDQIADVVPDLRELHLTRCPKNPGCLRRFKFLRLVALDFSLGYICNDRYMSLLGESLADCAALEELKITIESPKLTFHPNSPSLIFRLIFDYLVVCPNLKVLAVIVKLIKVQSLGSIKVDRETVSRGLRSRDSPLTVLLRNTALCREDFIDIPSFVNISFEG